VKETVDVEGVTGPRSRAADAPESPLDGDDLPDEI
jgi:hypothetical protein